MSPREPNLKESQVETLRTSPRGSDLSQTGRHRQVCPSHDCTHHLHPLLVTSTPPPPQSPSHHFRPTHLFLVWNILNLICIAIATHMWCSPEGQNILTMGPHLAVSTLTAMRELEHKIVAQINRDNDVQITACHLHPNWTFHLPNPLLDAYQSSNARWGL